MGNKRTLIAIGALVAALLAAFANYAYLNSVQDRAYEDAERLKVFVVSKDIAKGLPGEQALQEEFVKSDEIPREFRPGTAITDVTTIRGKVALNNLSAGQVVVDGMFVDPKVAQITFSQRIPAGKVAVTVSVGVLEGVGGLLVPGDKVNILANDAEGKRSLFQNVDILAIGTTAAPQAGETAPVVNPGSNMITFAVPPLAASKILVAGSLYLTLVPPDNQPVEIPPVNPGNLFTGGLTP
ncbi:MAG: Flp pilus assembly protein CpaB [Actinobacteria bacterium]|nr:Flp pilus assembly protein CpaB [Actinomycetota bacterium]